MNLNIILPQIDVDVTKNIVLLMFKSSSKNSSLKEKIIFLNLLNCEFHTQYMIDITCY